MGFRRKGEIKGKTKLHLSEREYKTTNKSAHTYLPQGQTLYFYIISYYYPVNVETPIMIGWTIMTWYNTNHRVPKLSTIL